MPRCRPSEFFNCPEHGMFSARIWVEFNLQSRGPAPSGFMRSLYALIEIRAEQAHREISAMAFHAYVDFRVWKEVMNASGKQF